MAKFSTGLLIGGIAGTLYALLTSKKTGQQRQREVANYFTDLTQATGDVQAAVGEFAQAMNNLKQEMNQTLQPAIKDITASVEEAEFEMSPRVMRLTSGSRSSMTQLIR